MKLAKDKIAHVVMGLLMLGYCWVFHWVLIHGGSGPAVAFAMTAGSIGVEAYQKARNEGEPSLADAAAGSALGWLYWGFTLAQPKLGLILPSLGL